MKRKITLIALIMLAPTFVQSHHYASNNNHALFKNISKDQELIEAKILSIKLDPNTVGNNKIAYEKIAFGMILRFYINSYANAHISKETLIDITNDAKRILASIPRSRTYYDANVSIIYKDVENNKRNNHVLAMKAFLKAIQLEYIRVNKTSERIRAKAHSDILKELTIAYINNNIPNKTLENALINSNKFYEEIKPN